MIETRNIAMKCDAKKCKAKIRLDEPHPRIENWVSVYTATIIQHYCPAHIELALNQKPALLP